MKKLLITLMLLTAVGLSPTLRAQTLGSYRFSTGIDASKWINLNSTTNLITSTGDNALSQVQSIGFMFPYGNEVYTQYSVNADGNLRLGGTLTGTANYATPFSSANAKVNNPKINGMGCDGFFTDSCHVYAENTVNANNDSLLVVEFYESTFTSTSRGSLLKWQVHLYPSGKIEIVYHNSRATINPATTHQVGFCMDDTDGWVVNSSHVATHFTSGSSVTWATGTWPDAARYYSFEDTATSVCYKPSTLSVSGLTPTSFDISWMSYGPVSQWVLRIDDTTQGTANVVNTTTHHITGLTPNTTYTVNVASLCNDGDTSEWVSTTLRTPCSAIETLPYSYNFDDATASGTNGIIDACWTRQRMGTTTNYPYPSTTHCHSNNYAMYFYNTAGGSTRSWLSLPLFESNVNTLQLAFYALKTSANYGRMLIGVMDNPNDINTFDTVAVLDINDINTWEDFEVPLNNYAGNGRYITILANSAVANYFYVDDVTVDVIPTCVRPTDLVMSNATTNSIELSWNENGSATEWLIEYGEADFVRGQGTFEVATTNTAFLLGNLNPSIKYDIYISALCSDGDTSTTMRGKFNTLCGELELPFTYGFENDATGSAAQFPYCWNRINDATGTSNYYPYVTSSTTSAHNGAKYLYFYQSSSSTYAANQYAVLPPVNTSNTQMSEVELLFWAKPSSTIQGELIVGVMTDPTNDSTFTAVDTLTIATGAYNLYSVSFANYADTGKYVAIRGRRLSSSVYTYVDDITLRQVNNCPSAEGFAVTALSDNEVTIEWNSNSMHTGYTVYYGTADFSLDTAMNEVTADTTITLSNLMPNTVYEYIVTAACADGSESYASSRYTFRTACAPINIDSSAYVEDFEAYTSGSSNTISPCWTKGTNYSTQYPYPYSTAAINGSIGLYFYSTSTYYSYAALPAFENEVSSLRLRFNAKRYSTTSYRSVIAVGVMTNPNDISTFETVEIIDLTNEPSSSIHAIEVNMDQYTGNGRYIALSTMGLATAGQTNYIYIDDVRVDRLPACRVSYALTSDNISTHAADLSWENSNDNVVDYTVALSTNDNFNPDTCTNTYTVTTNALTLSNLADFTTYYWTVKANCGGDNSQWANIAQFLTPLDCGDNYRNILDTIGNGTSSSATYTMYTSTTYPTAYSRNIFTMEEMVAMGVQSNNRINGISIHCGGTGGTIPGVSIYMVETDLEGFGSPAANDTIAPANMTLVFQGNIVAAANNWVEIAFDSAFNYSGTRNLMVCLARNGGSCSAAATFYYTTTSPNYRSAYGYRSSATTANNTCLRSYYRTNMAFNICTEVPVCLRPDSLTASNITDSSVSLTWDGSASHYEIVYDTVGFDPDQATPITVTADSCTLNGLTSNMQYDIYVRAACNLERSAWSLPISVQTDCTPIALPYSEDFEAYGSGASNPINNCWRKGTNNTTQYPYPYSTNAINGNRSLYFYAYRPSTTTSTAYYSYAALPKFDAPVDTLVLTFYARRYSSTTETYTSRIVVGVMSDPNDINTFDAVDTIDLKAEPALSVHGVEVSFENYRGNGRHIALYNEVPPLYGNATNSYSYIYVDDITVDYRSTCPAPANVTVADSNITTTTAVVSWTDRATAAMGYQIEYGPQGFELGNGTRVNSNSNPTTLTGLTPSTQYDVYVRAICSATDEGVWSFSAQFTTECAAIDMLPVTFDFENEAAGTSSPLPVCWNRINDATGTTNYYPYIYNSTSNAHSGSKCLYFYTSTTSTYATNMLAVLPEVDTTVYPTNTLEVVFWGRGSATTTYDNSVMVGIMTDPTDNSTFVVVDTIALTPTMTEYTVPFNNVNGYGSYIAFKKVRSTTTGYAYIDDITIEQMSACARPYNLRAITSTATTATIGWSDSIGATQWMVEYSAEGDTNSTSINANTNPFTLTGLTAATTYQFRVAAMCPDGVNMSDFSRNTCNFATSQIPATLPYVYNFEDSTEWNNWQTISNQTTNWYRGNDTAFDGNYSMYLSSNNGATRGTDMEQVINACAYRDIDFGAPGNSYTISFKAEVGGTVGNNYDGVSILLVDPSEVVEPSTANIVSPWGHVNDIALGTVRHSDGWNSYSYHFDNVSGVKRVVFYWFNQSTGVANFEGEPAAIDSIVVEQQPCQRPYDIAVASLSNNDVTLTWGGDAMDEYDVIYRIYSEPASTNTTVRTTGTSLRLTSLSSNTRYICWVRHICDSTLSSDYSDAYTFTTACNIFSASDTMYEDFHTTPGVAYNMEGQLPMCWEGYSNGTDSKYMPHVVDSGTYWYTASDSSCVILTSGSAATHGNTKILRLPLFAEPVNSLTLSYWMATEGSSAGTLSVGYLTGDDFENDFVSIKDIPASSRTIHSGTGLQPTAGIYDTVSFDSVPARALYVAFKWYHNSTFFSVALDNIEVTAHNICATPIITNTSNDYANITVEWTGNGENYEVAIKESTVGAWNEAIATSAQTYTFTGLQAATSYDIQVRQDCSADSLGYSEWAQVTVITDSLPCFMPTALAITNTGYDNATLGWTNGGEESEWVLHVWRSDVDIFDTVSTNPTTVEGLYSGMTYSAAVAARCGNGAAYSDWSDTIQFTTEICQPVSNVTVNDITNSSATIAWTAPEGSTQWQLNYGMMDFTQGQGSMETTTSNPYTINGLENDTYYDVYVRTQCGDELFSDWTNKVTFMTEPVGIDRVDNNAHIAIFPNPTSGNTTISWDNTEETWSIDVVDLQGRTVNKYANIQGTSFQMTNMPTGTYFLRIYSNSISTVKKLIVR